MQDFCEGNNSSRRRYQLRCAAGLFWLIDMEQPGDDYISPVPLNEVGADIWKMIESGMNEQQICEQLCGEYGLSAEEAQEDLRDFVAQLKAQKVDFGGTE